MKRDVEHDQHRASLIDDGIGRYSRLRRSRWEVLADFPRRLAVFAAKRAKPRRRPQRCSNGRRLAMTLNSRAKQPSPIVCGEDELDQAILPANAPGHDKPRRTCGPNDAVNDERAIVGVEATPEAPLQFKSIPAEDERLIA